MKIEEMITAAHQNALSKGFWDDMELVRDDQGDSLALSTEMAFVSQKLALIVTEVREFEEAAPEERLEELADIVIRVFDLCGFYGYSGDGMNFEVTERTVFWVLMVNPERELAIKLYRLLADTVRSHRVVEDGDAWLSFLDAVVLNVAAYAEAIFGYGKLVDAIEEKMHKNKNRSYKHGRHY